MQELLPLLTNLIQLSDHGDDKVVQAAAHKLYDQYTALIFRTRWSVWSGWGLAMNEIINLHYTALLDPITDPGLSVDGWVAYHDFKDAYHAQFKLPEDADAENLYF